MQKYKYVAVDINQKKIKGYFLAKNLDDLRLLLAKQKLYLVKATEVKSNTPSAFFSLTGKVKTKELTTFCRQFSILINSGVAIVDSLNLLKNQSFSSFFQKVLTFVYEDVKSGLLLSEAMSKHKKVFPHFLTSMSRVGEQSGTLDQVFISCADYYEMDAKIKRNTKSALVYPMFLVFMMIGVVALMVGYVIPTFEESLSQMEVEMPALTKSIMNISHWFTLNWKVLFLSIVVVFLIIFLVKQTEKGKYFFDSLSLKLPIIGGVQTSLITARFARGFGLLIASGMDVLTALQSVSIVLGNSNVEKRFNKAITDVEEGVPINEALAKYKIFPAMLLQMILVGEKTGCLDKVLLKSSPYFDEQAEKTLTAMTSLLQPIVLCLMGVIIGVLFIAIYSPILNMTNLL